MTHTLPLYSTGIKRVPTTSLVRHGEAFAETTNLTEHTWVRTWLRATGYWFYIRISCVALEDFDAQRWDGRLLEVPCTTLPPDVRRRALYKALEKLLRVAGSHVESSLYCEGTLDPCPKFLTSLKEEFLPVLVDQFITDSFWRMR